MLKNLSKITVKRSPYYTVPDSQIIYYEEITSQNHHFIEDNIKAIEKKLAECDFSFCYMPHLFNSISDFGSLNYYNPSGAKVSLNERSMYAAVKHLFRDNLKQGELGRHCFLKNDGNYSPEIYNFSCYEVDPTADFMEQLGDYLSLVYTPKNKVSDWGDIRFHIVSDPDAQYDADNMFTIETNRIMDEVRSKVNQLRKIGIEEAVIRSLFEPVVKPSRLVVTKDHRILLPDYNNLEIKMSALPKAVYLLFLKHPEGIIFKNLPDYQNELLDIYLKFTDRESGDVIMKSIEDVTNPNKNSINEKCTRIREAFISHFDAKTIAKYYVIDGRRGEAKKILLDINLVTWE